MPVPFGFGVGDFIAVLKLIARVAKALKESGGAASEYQDVVQELECLQTLLTHLGTVRFQDVASKKPAVRLTILISACQRPLEGFLERIARFYDSLDATSQRGLFHKAPRKAQWGAFMGEEIPKLRAIVAAKVMQIQLVLQLYITEIAIDTDSRTTKTHSLLLEDRSQRQTQFETVEKSTKGIQDHVNELAKVQKSSSAVLEDKLDQVEGKLSSIQITDVEACEQWCSIKDSVEATKQVVDEGTKTQKVSSEALEKKMDAATEKVTSRLSLLERCQRQYFPTLISYARSIKQVSQNNSNQLQEVRDCQRTYFPRLLFAIQATLVKFDDLLDLGAQLVRASQSVPAEICGLLKMLCERNQEVYLILKQRQQEISGPPQTPAQDSIHFEDVLGRTEDLPYTYFCNWQVFEAYLRVRFDDMPGQGNVRDGKYQILLNTKQQQIVRKDDYERMVFPGTKMTMSMILSLIKALAQYCPSPGCNTRGTRISETSPFYKCPECNLSFAPFEPEGSRVTTLPESRNKPIPRPRDTNVRARDRSRTASQEQRGESSERRKKPKNTRMQQRQKDRQGASNMGAREDAQSKELHDLSVFKRVHIHVVPSRFDWTGRRGWVAEVLGQTQQKTMIDRKGLPGRASAFYGEGDVKSIKDDLKGYDMVWHSRRNSSLEVPYRNFMFKFFTRPEDARAKILVADQFNNACLPLTSLLQERDCPIIRLHGPNSAQIWAIIDFLFYEDLVLFYCCFEALKARDRSIIATSIGACQVPGEENVFSGNILDRRVGIAILRVFKDTESPGVRLQASDIISKIPLWTAFVTHTLYSSTWMEQTGPRQVLLTDCQRLIFFSGETRGPYSLTFNEGGDALGFVEAMTKLRGT